MKIIIVKNYRELSKRASEIIIDEILKKPTLTLGFATGKTPLGLYKRLVRAYRKKKVDFSKIKTFNLDEFYPIENTSRKSYRHQMFKRVFNKINLNKKSIHLLDGSTKNPEKECAEYEKKIRKNSVDLQILGIGENGHIGFNEPGSTRNSKTRVVELTHLKGDGLTMGVSTIMKSKKLLMLASGRKKARPIKAMLKGKITKELPASFLINHKNLTVIIDRDAASLL